MAYSVTFNGQNQSGHVTYGGVRFPCGEAVTVDEGDFVLPNGSPDPLMFNRIRNNPEFSVVQKGRPPKDKSEGDAPA